MKNVLTATNISKTYGKGRGRVRAIRNCSLEFQRGEFVAIIGKSGSGKSTLLRMLGTLEPTDTGMVQIEGQSVTDLSDTELSKLRRERIGFVFQDYGLFPEFTAYENIVMPIHLDGRKENTKQILKVMDTLSILSCKDKFPAEMSGGEQQRVSIARAICTLPAVILADEPTGNLDAENANEVVMLLSKAARLFNQTIIMVTHDRQMADYADRIIKIKDGIIS